MHPELIILIIFFGLLFDFTNGIHDSANVVSTVIATKALKPLTAIIIAGIMNTIGATQISGVAKTITQGLISPQESSQLLIIAALVGAIFWNLLTGYLGIPSSSSYALVGGLIGGAIASSGIKFVFWKGVITKVFIPMILSPLVGFFLAYLFMKFLHKFRMKKNKDHMFRKMQIASSSIMALTHGFNDAQKSMAVITLGLFSSGLISTLTIPLWVILFCAFMMGLGTAVGGMRIIRTVGFSLTKLNPIQGFAAETSSSITILTASLLGMPVSSTQMIVGSVTGTGAAKKLSMVRWLIVHKLLVAWVLTLPGSGIVAALIVLALKLL